MSLGICSALTAGTGRGRGGGGEGDAVSERKGVLLRLDLAVHDAAGEAYGQVSVEGWCCAARWLVVSLLRTSCLCGL